MMFSPRCFLILIFILSAHVQAATVLTSCNEAFHLGAHTRELIRNSYLQNGLFELLPRFAGSEVSNRTPLQVLSNQSLTRQSSTGDFAGHRSLYLYRARVGDVDVHIKYPILDSHPTRQALMMRLLSDMGVGPKFFGYVKEEDDEPGVFGVITQFVPGAHISASTESIDSTIRVTPSTLSRLDEIIARFQRIGLVRGDEVQMRLTPDGQLFVIDTEFLCFEWESRGGPGCDSHDIISELYQIRSRLIAWMVEK